MKQVSLRRSKDKKTMTSSFGKRIQREKRGVKGNEKIRGGGGARREVKNGMPSNSVLGKHTHLNSGEAVFFIKSASDLKKIK